MRALFLVAATLLLANPALSRADDRPCGPASMTGPLRFLIPQGFGRTDFRPSCTAHDRCYENPNATKAECDARFRDRMLTACDGSRMPALCRLEARAMHASVRLFGDGAYRTAQAKTAGRGSR